MIDKILEISEKKNKRKKSKSPSDGSPIPESFLFFDSFPPHIVCKSVL